MTPKANHKAKYLIASILKYNIFDGLNKARKDFIISVLCHFLSIKDRLNFLQLSRFSPYCEQTRRIHFEQEFDFFAFNKHLTQKIVSKDCIIALDPSYIL
jgi:hypothetical protein